MKRPYLRTLLLLGALAATSCGLRSYKEPARTELAHADPSKLLSADPMFAESAVAPELLLSFIPKGHVAVGYNSCAYRAANVRHEKYPSGRGGVDYDAGETVANYRWGLGPMGCPSSTGTVYDPEDPHDNYKKNLKEGDIVHKRHLFLFSPADVANYFSGNKKGHELCYPVNCPPLRLKFEGVNGINEVWQWDEHGSGNVLWKG